MIFKRVSAKVVYKDNIKKSRVKTLVLNVRLVALWPKKKVQNPVKGVHKVTSKVEVESQCVMSVPRDYTKTQHHSRCAKIVDKVNFRTRKEKQHVVFAHWGMSKTKQGQTGVTRVLETQATLTFFNIVATVIVVGQTNSRKQM